MKYYLLLVSSLLYAFITSAQLTDLDIASSLIGKPGEEIETILDEFEIEYWITDQKEGKVTIFISYNNSIRMWKVSGGYISREILGKTKTVARDVITQVFIRYRHSNLNDLRDFYTYEQPPDQEFLKYEKSLGSAISEFNIYWY